MKIAERCFILLVALLWSNLVSFGQIDLLVVVTDGQVSTTCDDIFSGPDPQYEVTIGSTSIVYPEDGNCYQNPPFLNYSESFTCPADLPATLTVCLDVFENDGLLFCNVNKACLVTICQDFALPAVGDSISYTLATPTGGDSEGSVDLLFGIPEPTTPNNNLPCDAVDLGTITFGGMLGDATQNLYNNRCADNENEPQPSSEGGIFNSNGVWFKFNSGPNPSGKFTFEAFNNPDGLGEDIDLQIALYEATGDPCNGGLTYITSRFDNDTDDIRLTHICPTPDTDYYLLIDGSEFFGMDGIFGDFGIQVSDIGIVEGGDRRCDFIDLGVVADGGAVMTDQPYANFCATSVQDPFVNGFVSQHSVFFAFTPPPSGHVIIEAISQEEEPIGLQLALYRSFSNACTGFYTQVTSQYTSADLDEVMEVSCLFDDRPYFLLVDGDGSNSRGAFTITVTDAGDITPTGNQELSICAGTSLDVGSNSYDVSGVYTDTLPVFAGCDSIVITNLTVLPEINVTIEQLTPSIGEGGNEGTAQVSALGGAGNYTFEWCNGQTGTNADNLIGGQECCVIATDELGCEMTACFDVIFTTDIIPFFTADTLDCAGDTDGIISFGPTRGIPPYTYTWTNSNGSLTGSGDIMAEGQEVSLPSLPADDYSVTLADNYGDTTFTIQVLEPTPLVISPDQQVNASCFDICDGQVQPLVTGGTPPYTYAWSNGQTNLLAENLCDGTYTLTVRDANACEASFDVTITEPEEFIATIVVTQEVSCQGGTDGILSVETNGNPQAFDWNGLGDQVNLSGIPTGNYEVLVTNDDGCQAVATGFLPEPDEPLMVNISVVQVISCTGASDAMLIAEVEGPYTSLSFNWSDGQMGEVANGLSAGEYGVLVTNERGCTAEALFRLDDPPVLTAALAVQDISCRPEESRGTIQVIDVVGGRPDYEYALGSNGTFSTANEFGGLEAGPYTVLVRDAFGCEISLNTQVLPAPELVVDLGLDQDIHLGDSIRLFAATNSNSAALTWSHDGTITTDEPWVRPLSTTLYTVSARDSISDCTAEAFVRVFVTTDRRIFIPNVFSPNDDGVNDLFFIYGGNEVLEIKSFQIFARNGGMVYEEVDLFANDSSRAWDGKYRDELLPTGVYVYQAVISFIDGKEEVFSGDVVLMR